MFRAFISLFVAGPEERSVNERGSSENKQSSLIANNHSRNIGTLELANVA